MSKSKLSKSNLRQLMSYSTAAGLGAFAFGQQADGAPVVYTATGTGPNGGLSMGSTTLGGVPFDLPVGVADGNIEVGVDEGNQDTMGLGGKDVAIVHNGSRVQFRAHGAGFGANSSVISAPLGGAGYYTFGLPAGELIGDGINEYINTDHAAPYGSATFVSVYGYDYNFVAAPNNYVGFQFDVGANLHYGWLEVNNGFDDNGIPYTELIRFAWESTPNTPIMTPEPSALLLLAAGVGGLGLRRRSNVA